ncbi:MAG: type II toxin-antitoxin system HicA family toxin [Chitinophagales bacterium]
MKLPRDVTGGKLVKALCELGYTVTRQKGSHMRVTTQKGGEHLLHCLCHNLGKIHQHKQRKKAAA